MIRINENGDLVESRKDSDGAPFHICRATAAELKAAFADRGMVVISVEDANALQIGCGSGPYSQEELAAIDAACERLDAALKESGNG